MFEIIFTFAKDSDIRKIRIGESFEYLSHLQRFRHSKDSTQNFFPNLSNVLNILLTSLFLQKIQIFERFNSGESLVNLLVNLFGESFAKIQTFERFALANLLNICHICKDSDIQKIQLKIFSRIFRMF